MTFLVTYAAFDSEFGNPLWHSFILLSRAEEGKKIEVVETWGFYGVPSSDPANSYLKKCKLFIGLDIDLSGNHGWLRHEEIRYLDTGTALHGVTFELTEAKFLELQKKCQDMENQQKAATEEAVKYLGLQVEPAKKTKIYPYEKHARLIYEREKKRAEEQGQPPRLHPFETIIKFNSMMRMNLDESHTCKSQILSLLDGILDADQIDRLTVNGKHPTVPKYSGCDLERIYFHSEGNYLYHKKKSGQIVKNRALPSAKLYWSLPPQNIVALNQSIMKLFKISDEYCDEVKQLIHQLQGIENLFINAQLPERLEYYREHLIKLIREHYQAFSVLTRPRDQTSIQGYAGYALALFSLPRNDDEKVLLKKIADGKYLIQNLYMAVADNWQTFDDMLAEFEAEDDKESDCRAAEENLQIFKELPSYLVEEDRDCLEALAAYLTKEDKNTLYNLTFAITLDNCKKWLGKNGKDKLATILVAR